MTENGTQTEVGGGHDGDCYRKDEDRVRPHTMCALANEIRMMKIMGFITLGALGAVLVSDRGSWFAPAPRVDVVDTTAAGDAFVGALAVGISEGRSAADALGFAVAAGSLAVTRPGAQPSLPGRADTAALARTVSPVSLAGGA